MKTILSPESLTQRLIRRFTQAAVSASKKEFMSELTEDEACAVCLFAGVPYELDIRNQKIKFEPCVLTKVGGKWKALC
jgi:hypothetical protein